MKALMNYNLFFSIEKTPWKTIHEPQTKVAGERKVCPEYEIFKICNNYCNFTTKNNENVHAAICKKH